ncbi:DUF4277 domain-containing protein [Anabaena sp. PCC 7108]|uniref:DUF4277 domain-containing protein n=1 Tax=Anabaena sp. PCC 7108 TaxID=163908 RepID=UPI000346D45D|nr:DUF4277 domain-containing protein [Anabaena sp. PCC 7108]
MKESQVAMPILNIDHLGIVAGIIDEMELVEEVNKIVGIKTREILTPGQVIIYRLVKNNTLTKSN